MDGEVERRLGGGGEETPVVRVGDTVRRPTGPWTPAVHAVLRHLEAVGFPGAPRVLGVDEHGREILSYLPSEQVWPYSEPVLVGVARLLRQLHDALATFTLPPGAVWRYPTPDAATAVMGHNDVAPFNTVFADGLPYGFIDWELAGPRPPLYDFACAAINFTPLRPDRFCQMVGFPEPPDRGRRLRIFCEEYGLEDRSTLLEALEAFERDALRELVELGRSGVSPYDRYLARGEDVHLRWDLEWLVINRPQLEVALR